MERSHFCASNDSLLHPQHDPHVTLIILTIIISTLIIIIINIIILRYNQTSSSIIIHPSSSSIIISYHTQLHKYSALPAHDSWYNTLWLVNHMTCNKS